MRSIAFIDTEVDVQSKRIIDMGAIREDGATFHKASLPAFNEFINGVQFLCGHNIINHDLKYLKISSENFGSQRIIDTLFLSPLLFPTKPYHSLIKDDKLQTEDINNPLNDSIKARDLFYDEVEAFKKTDTALQQIFYHLLKDKKEFKGFFHYLAYQAPVQDTRQLILDTFKNQICDKAEISKIISENPIELAFALSLIHSLIRHKEIYSITPPWVIRNYPEVKRIMFLLRDKPCISGCFYCHQVLDAHKGMKRFFGFDSFRTYDGEPLQERAVKAAIDNKSILAIFPTGGGKSITFQLPALMSGENARALTVVISPLQSLMKDQVDNLEKMGITNAVTINGLLDPIERAKSFERVEDGSASILYISPESLRSRSIEKLISGRNIARFVIDEAHCFSAWGQDFRVDYLYIGDFIKSLQERKNLTDAIPVSCFTATARQAVIRDIQNYFSEKLSLELELFTSGVARTNLHYKVFEQKDEEEKYQTLRSLIEEKSCPTIVYVSRTRKAFDLAKRLSDDGFRARAYHGKMDKQEKSENQDSFISGHTQVMVATSAFGMGVDKKDVGMVVHFEISDSLENYIQEAGRAGRDENLDADCFVLFNEEDLSKHFILLNQTKLSIKEIQQIWKAIKEITRFRSTVSNSALEIARKAGWDDRVVELETRVTTAIAALEDAGYLKRGQNMPKVFANSILAKNLQQAIDKINHSYRFDDRQKEQAIRILKKLFSSKSRKYGDDDPGESRIDYISDHLGIPKKDVIYVVELLREEKILAESKDLTAFLHRNKNKNSAIKTVENFSRVENFLFPLIEEREKVFNLKELNDEAEKSGIDDVNVHTIKTILNFWGIKNWIKKKNSPSSKNHIALLGLHPKNILQEKLAARQELAGFIIDSLYEKSEQSPAEDNIAAEEFPVEFSVHELKTKYEKSHTLFKKEIGIEDIEDTLFFLSRIGAIKIEGGFLVIYNPLTIERTEQNNKKGYTREDYRKLNQFYENKIQQIHIVGEYAKRMMNDYKDALQFVDDYFHLNYSSFLQKYFKGSRQNEIKRNLTPGKFRELFGSLSPAQLKIINDKDSGYIVVAAGPGSGKTRVLVHKLASLLLMEDVKHEQLLMLTFSRAAATEFKKRLLKLIGNAANYVEIKTFHSYCFDLLGKVGSLEKSDAILKETVSKISTGEVEINRITKTVLVIDEAQDMNADEFDLIKALMKHNEEMRVIAVGDDDQNIYEFRGSSSQYLEQFINIKQAVKYELIENYRSRANLVDFTNQFVNGISHRLKSTSIIPKENKNGKIRIVQYQSRDLITPLVQSLLADELTGTTCVLTKTNEEALQVAGQLLLHKRQAKLIQSNDGFNLINLAEVRYFINQLGLSEDVFIISNDSWQRAKVALKNKYHKSSQYEICTHLIRDFELTNPVTKYKSDFNVFIRESAPEDFQQQDGETILVSTMHKAKGREFDNVYILSDGFVPVTDQDKRLLYVAMTRAKTSLFIHLNGNYLNHLRADNIERKTDQQIYSTPDTLTIQPGLRDVWLDYFIRRQYHISDMISGEPLIIHDEELYNQKGRSVVKFSAQFKNQIEQLKQKGFILDSANVNYMVYWKKDETDQEVLVILPELHFKKQLQYMLV